MQTIELSEEGRNFLQHLFLAFDENQDALLSDAEQSEMFSAAPTRYLYPPPTLGFDPPTSHMLQASQDSRPKDYVYDSV